MIKTFYKLAGFIFTLIAFVFMFSVLMKMNFENFISKFSITWVPIILLFSLVYVVQTFMIAIAWKKIIRLLSSEKFSAKDAVEIYLKTNIAKYLPSNALHFAGRQILGKKLGVTQLNLMIGSVLEISLIMVVSILIILLSIHFKMIEIPPQIFSNANYQKIYLLFMVLICLFVASKHKLIFSKVNSISFQGLSRYIHGFTGILLLYFIYFVVSGLLLYILFYFLTGISHLSHILLLISTFTIAWLAGFVVPGAPGGIGVRESVIVLMLSPVYGQDNSVIAAIILRLVTILGEVAAFLSIPLIKVLNYKTKEEI